MQDGTYHQSNGPYGYRWSNGTNGEMVPDPVDSAVVQWMFEKVLEGKGTSYIAKELNKAGIPSPRGSTWCDYSARIIIKNPAMAGDLLMNKRYKDRDYKSHNNLGERPMYYQDGHHEPIVSKETFELAQAAIAQRGREKGNTQLPAAERVKHQDPHIQHYTLSGRLYCGGCGSAFKRRTQYTANGTRIRWVCARHLEDKEACPMRNVLEDNVKNAFVTLIHKLQYADFILDDYCGEIAAIERKANKERLSEINSQLQQNTDARNRLAQLLQTGCAGSVSYQQGMVKLEEEAAKLKDERGALAEAKDSPTVQLRRFVRSFDGDTFPDDAFLQFVEKVVIQSETRYTFIFTCGLELTEDI